MFDNSISDQDSEMEVLWYSRWIWTGCQEKEYLVVLKKESENADTKQ